MNAAAGLVEVRVPDMGNFKDVAIIDVLVKPGEKIEPEAPLVTLETEKATMDVPSTVGGIVEKVHIKKGGTVSPGDLIVTVRSEGAATSPSDGAAESEAAPGASARNAPNAGAAVGSGGGAAGGGAPGSGAAGSGRAGAGAGSNAAAGGAGASGAGATGEGSGANAGATDRARAGGGSGASGTAGRSGAGAAGGGAPGSGAAGSGRASAAASSGAGAARAGAAGATGVGAAGSGPSAGAAGAGSGAGTASAGWAGAGAGAAAGGPSGSAGGRTGASVGASGAGAPGADSAGAGGAGAAGGSQNGAAGAQAASGRSDLPPINEPGFSRAHAGPSVRRFARELGVDLTQVKGGGFKGRVTHDDVKAFVKKFLAGAGATAKGAPGPAGGTSLPAVPVIDFSQFGAIETRPLSRIQKISGPRLHASWVNIPHVTQFDEADITDLEEIRGKLKEKAQQANIKLTPLAFILRACAKALQEFPLFNSSLDATGANLVLKKYMHLGFAADTPNGLVVPVVRDANRKDVYEIARQLGELSEKARAGKLQAAEMQGGSFTISSLGGIGGTAFTPIINAPEVAILGVSRSAMRPVFRDGAFVPRLILPLSLSYDHRVIDGASAARFTTYLAQTLADPRGLTEAVP
jgi:pyruvate dehydrogenase E2 component (dihydrolipoamide acetyltransferase)